MRGAKLLFKGRDQIKASLFIYNCDANWIYFVVLKPLDESPINRSKMSISTIQERHLFTIGPREDVIATEIIFVIKKAGWSRN